MYQVVIKTKLIIMRVNFDIKLTSTVVVLIAIFGSTLPPVEGQFFNALANLFRPIANAFRPRFVDDGTQTPQATGTDEVFPRDCGTNVNTGRGKLCFPVGNLCAERK